MAILPVKFETLPEDIREMLRSDELVEKIELIGEKQSLPPMEQGFLVHICAKLMTGLLSPANFVNTIADELDIPREKASFIAQEVNRDIFSNIKESLKMLHTGALQTIPIKTGPQTPIAIAPIAPILQGSLIQPEVNAGSIFEQKLGGAFRMNTESSNSVGTP